MLINRRDVFRLGTAALMGLSTNGFSKLMTASAAESANSVQSADHPNILLIMTDQQQARMMSCAGNKWLKTPALDSLASRGVRFERSYCANPVCVPSRFSMQTGVLPSRIGMDRNNTRTPVPDTLLQNAIGNVFRRGGYKTVYGGKVHLPGAGIEAYGYEQYINRNEREGLAESAVEFLNQKQEQPFLLWVSFINPHDICYNAIDAYSLAQNPNRRLGNTMERQALTEALQIPTGMSRDEFFSTVCPPLPSNFEIPENEPVPVRESDWRAFRKYVEQNWSEEDWRMHRWAYARLTERVDGQIGHVLDALHENGLDSNTVVVFLSDHGDMDASHRLEHKSMPYEEAMNVPLIISGPGITLQGSVVRTNMISTGLDLIPTLCDFAGIEAPSGLAGRSVKPLTLSPNEPVPWRNTLVIENEISRILISENYKYAVYDHGEQRELLIDIKADPGEMNNLASDKRYLDVVASHRLLLRQWYEENGETLDEKFIVTS